MSKLPSIEHLESMSDFLFMNMWEMTDGDLYKKISPQAYELIHNVPEDSDVANITHFHRIVKNYLRMKRIA